MIPLSVSEISALDGFCDEHVQEWGILAVGCQREGSMKNFKYLNINIKNINEYTKKYVTNAVHCHFLLSGHYDCHDLTIVKIH